MAYSINGKLKVAVSSRALFQLEKEDEIFLKKGKEAYERYQVKHEKDVLQPGAAFPVVKALLELGEDDVEVIVVSRNTADTSLRVFNSIQAHGLNICRGFFTGGESIINYLKSLDIDLYLTANDDSARAAIDNGIPAATMITSAAKYMTETTELRVAFDGDAVLFGDESEAVFKSEGLEAFGKSESEKANALEDKSNDKESFDYGTEDISDVDETVDNKTNEVTALNAYNVFSDYHIDYTAQRLDFIQMREV